MTQCEDFTDTKECSLPAGWKVLFCWRTRGAEDKNQVFSLVVPCNTLLAVCHGEIGAALKAGEKNEMVSGR